MGPHELDRFPEPGMAVDHADHGGSDAPGDEIVHATLPSLEGFAPTELQRHELLLAVGENGHHPEDRGRR
jgi:hypothetical protein